MATEEAQQQFTPAEPKAEHRWLQRLVGAWTFESEAQMAPDRPPETVRGAVSTRPLGKLWILTEGHDSDPDREMHQNLITLGYDPQKGRFVGTFVDSMMAFMWVYDGWLERDTLTLEATGPRMDEVGGMAQYRDVIEIVDDDHWILRSLFHADDGRWLTFMTSHYRRRK